MTTSKVLWNERRALAERMQECVENGNTDDAFRIEGQIAQIDLRIEEALEAEELERNSMAGMNVGDNPFNFAEQILGPRNSFQGIDVGFMASAPMDAISKLATPQIYRYDMPDAVKTPSGFLETIPKGKTNGDEHFLITPKFTNNAAGWTTGDKPESSLEWPEGVAHIETIPHHIPILKQNARRYEYLEDKVNNTLLMGLDLKCDDYALNGKNSSGIVGITNTSGITVHKKAEGKNIIDTIMSMRRKVRVGSGMNAGFLCLSSYALESVYQEKDETGRYYYDIREATDKILGLTVVEDEFMTDLTSTPKERALVYWNGGASFDIADPQEVNIGLIGNQFIQNAYTLLAEITAAFRVEMPSAFCLCEDLGIAPENGD